MEVIVFLILAVLVIYAIQVRPDPLTALVAIAVSIVIWLLLFGGIV